MTTIRRTAGDGVLREPKAVVATTGGHATLYDPDNHKAWIRSTMAIPEGDLR